MAKKKIDKGADNTSDNGLDNGAGENSPNTPQNASKDVGNTVETKDVDFLDSDSGDIGASLTSILNVPTETISTEQTAEDKSSVLEGYDVPETNDFKKSNSSGGDFSESIDDFTDLGEDGDSPFFEDNELLAEIGIELIDMMMTYGAMAVAQDFDNEEKYAIKDKRKKKLQAPLEKILQNREVKTSPELVFCFMMIVIYSPMYVSAVKERRDKKNAKGQVGGNPVPQAQPVITNLKNNSKQDVSVVPQSKEDVENGDDSQHPLSDMLSNMKPKRKAGRPVGSTDLQPRKNLDDNERGRQIEKAKALRKDGWSFARIGKELNVSEGTATRWVRKAK
jgi:hypothetical protein